MINIARILPVTLLLIIVIGCSQNATIAVPLATTRADISSLAADNMQGRMPGSVGIERAARFIEQYFTDIGVKPLFYNSFRDTFDALDDQTYNIVGVINSENSDDGYVLIGAHYDHLGIKKGRADSIFNGANDNASGVVTVLEIASMLKKYKLNKKIIIALFSAEERGLVGSNHLAKRLKKEGIIPEYMVNFEMVGAMLIDSPGMLYITGFKMSNMASELNRMSDKTFIVDHKIVEEQGLFRRSDNYPFYEYLNIPAHTVSSFDFTNFKYYHKVEDDISHVNVENLNKIINNSVLALVKLLQSNATIKLY